MRDKQLDFNPLTTKGRIKEWGKCRSKVLQKNFFFLYFFSNSGILRRFWVENVPSRNVERNRIETLKVGWKRPGLAVLKLLRSGLFLMVFTIFNIILCVTLSNWVEFYFFICMRIFNYVIQGQFRAKIYFFSAAVFQLFLKYSWGYYKQDFKRFLLKPKFKILS